MRPECRRLGNCERFYNGCSTIFDTHDDGCVRPCMPMIDLTIVRRGCRLRVPMHHQRCALQTARVVVAVRWRTGWRGKSSARGTEARSHHGDALFVLRRNSATRLPAAATSQEPLSEPEIRELMNGGRCSSCSLKGNKDQRPPNPRWQLSETRVAPLKCRYF